jgi:hypothetical protein
MSDSDYIEDGYWDFVSTGSIKPILTSDSLDDDEG